MQGLHCSTWMTVTFLTLTSLMLNLVGFVLPAMAADVSICEQFGTVNINGKVYVVQNNAWNDNAWNPNLPQCLSVDNVSGAFVVTSASANLPTNEPPASYPSVFKGCHWGNCTTNSGLPVQVSTISSVITNWNTTQPSTGVYNAAYDLWFHSAPTTSGRPDAELMIWLNRQGGILPAGSQVASAVSIAGTTWDVWIRDDHDNEGSIISYLSTTSTTSVSDFNLMPFFSDAVSRGEIHPDWYLITVEAGFEIWQDGTGLGSNLFSVAIASGAPSPTCDIQMSNTSYVTGDTVTAQVARLANSGPNPVPVEVKLWFEVPASPPMSFLTVGADGSFVLSPGFDQDFGPLALIPVQTSLPRGEYQFNCRLLDAVTGAPLADDVNPFQLQ